MKLLGIAGRAGTGKDTAAAVLVKEGWKRVAFADPLRRILIALDPFIGEHVSVRLSALIAAGEQWDDIKRTWPEVRRLMQRIGTEVGRELFGPDVWIQKAAATVAAIRRSPNPPPGVVIPDVRFPNEAEWIRSQGGAVLMLERSQAAPVAAHPSEACDFDADYEFDNSGTPRMLEQYMLSLGGWHLDDNPTPEEITERASEIRALWDDQQERQRRIAQDPEPLAIPYAHFAEPDLDRAE